jgi:hypothetical protein
VNSASKGTVSPTRINPFVSSRLDAARRSLSDVGRAPLQFDPSFELKIGSNPRDLAKRSRICAGVTDHPSEA